MHVWVCSRAVKDVRGTFKVKYQDNSFRVTRMSVNFPCPSINTADGNFPLVRIVLFSGPEHELGTATFLFGRQNAHEACEGDLSWRGVIFVDGSHLMQIMRVEDEKMPHIGLRKTALAACNEIRVVAVRFWIAVAERIRGPLDVITYCPAPVNGSYVEVEDGLTREAVGDLVLIVAVESSPTVAVKKFTIVVIGCSPDFNI